MLTITTNSFENDVLHADKPVLVDFWANLHTHIDYSYDV